MGILLQKKVVHCWLMGNTESQKHDVAFSFYTSGALPSRLLPIWKKSHRNCRRKLRYHSRSFLRKNKGQRQYLWWWPQGGVFSFFLWCNIVCIYLKRYKKTMCEWKISIISGLNCSLFLLKHGWKWGHAQPFTDWSWHFACWRPNQPRDWNRPQHSAGNSEGIAWLRTHLLFYCGTDPNNLRLLHRVGWLKADIWWKQD